MRFTKGFIYKELVAIDPEIFKKVSTSKAITACLDIVLTNFRLEYLDKMQWDELKLNSKVFISKLQAKFSSCFFIRDYFEKYQEPWLSTEFRLFNTDCDLEELDKIPKKPGAPVLKWNEKGERSQRDDLAKLVDNSLEKLIAAAAYKARNENKNDLRFVLLESIKSSESATNIKLAYKNFSKNEKLSRCQMTKAWL